MKSSFNWDYIIENRSYQLDILNRFRSYKKILCVWPRISGKELTIFNLIDQNIEWLEDQAISRHIYWMFPSYKIAQLNLENYIPSFRNNRCRNNELTFKSNNTFVHVIGSDLSLLKKSSKPPLLLIISEYESCSPGATKKLMSYADSSTRILIMMTPLITPITPIYPLYSQWEKDWDAYISHLTVEDTQHISKTDLENFKNEYCQEIFLNEFYSHIQKKD